MHSALLLFRTLGCVGIWRQSGEWSLPPDFRRRVMVILGGVGNLELGKDKWKECISGEFGISCFECRKFMPTKQVHTYLRYEGV